MRTFRETIVAIKDGSMKAPAVYYGGKQIDAIMYQLLVHRLALRVMANGMQYRGVKLKDIKEYYELKGRSAKDVLEHFENLFNNYQTI